MYYTSWLVENIYLHWNHSRTYKCVDDIHKWVILRSLVWSGLLTILHIFIDHCNCSTCVFFFLQKLNFPKKIPSAPGGRLNSGEELCLSPCEVAKCWATEFSWSNLLCWSWSHLDLIAEPGDEAKSLISVSAFQPCGRRWDIAPWWRWKWHMKSLLAGL